MPREIVWAKPALEELGEELAYIRYADPEAAQALYDEIMRQLSLVLEQPELGTQLLLQKQRLRVLVPHKTFKLLYRVEPDSIHVVAFLHTRRNLKRAFKSRTR